MAVHPKTIVDVDPYDFDKEQIDNEIIASLPKGTYFDKEKADRVVNFIHALKHTKGKFYGKPFRLLDWEYKLVRAVYGTIDEQTGLRRYTHVYLEIPKKNGKSELVAALALYHLLFDNEPNGEIYGCAGDREQAGIIFHTAVEMILQSPTLTKRTRITGEKKGSTSPKSITDLITNSLYKVVSAEAYTKHGLNISACLFDELHVQPNRDLFDVMSKGAGDAREQPIWWFITTAGDDPDRVTIGWEVHEKAVSILDAREAGDTENDIPFWYPVIFGYDGEDIFNEENWKVANPSLGHTFAIEKMRNAALDAKKSKADERSFRWLRLNQWVTIKLTGWLPIDLFDTTNGEWSRNDLLGAECYIGGDFSTTIDLSTTCLLFPPQSWSTVDSRGKTIQHSIGDWRCFWDAWIPEDTMKERIEEDKVPYDKWAAEGWITPTPGRTIAHRRIFERIGEYKSLYKIKELPFDISFATMLVTEIQEDLGLTVSEALQTYQALTDPMNQIEIFLREKLLTHESNPVARWCFGNTSISKNGNAQIKYVKERKGKGLDRTKRIDLTVALILAMQRARFYNTSNLDAILSDDWGM